MSLVPGDRRSRANLRLAGSQDNKAASKSSTQAPQSQGSQVSGHSHWPGFQRGICSTRDHLWASWQCVARCHARRHSQPPQAIYLRSSCAQRRRTFFKTNENSAIEFDAKDVVAIGRASMEQQRTTMAREDSEFVCGLKLGYRASQVRSTMHHADCQRSVTRIGSHLSIIFGESIQKFDRCHTACFVNSVQCT